MVQAPVTPASIQGPVLDVDEADVPNDLTLDERHVWLELAPHALVNGTLTKATELSFGILCRNVAIERLLARDPKTVGGPNHRGILTRVDAELLRFCLSPFGKPLYEAPAATPVNPLEKFIRKAG